MRRRAAPLQPELKAKLTTAFDLHRRGDLGKAESLYREVLAAAPRCYDALHLLGVAVGARGAHAEALDWIRRAIDADAAQRPARFSLARTLIDAQDAAGADAASKTLIALDPANADAWLLRGNALQLAADHEAAVESFERALTLRANLPAALNNQGHSLRLLRRTERALAAFDRALELQPGYAMALNNRGLALLDMRLIAQAIECFDAALAAVPEFCEARSNRGTALLEQKRFAEAARDFARLAQEAPNLGGVWGNLLWARRNYCDWADQDELGSQIIAAVQSGAFADTPLAFLCTSDSPQAQLICARTFTQLRYPPRTLPPSTLPTHNLPTRARPAAATDRIRVAYLSGDFGAHAVSSLLAGVIECHDAERYETVALAWGRHDDGEMRRRLERVFGRFIDVTHQSDLEIATLLRESAIDIAVDLMGHTCGQRTGIFAYRAAPIQVNFLGFPGTSGASYMDYLIADAVAIPIGEEQAYSERVIRLPHCFLPTDDRRVVSRGSPTRAQVGLPVDGFVFCAFNNPVKIAPPVFSIWMQLLREVPGSVLWLRADVREAQKNLLREAIARDVDPERLVFAPALEAAQAHLARYRLADLFLDTLPYNAHATACDALWAGLPVLTCRGGSFAGRVGASLLGALGMPELVTDNLDDYARTALELARDPQRMGKIRIRLEEQRRQSPAFDTARYCRNLEAAYAAMCARHRLVRS